MTQDAKQKDIELRTEMVRCGYWRSCLNCALWKDRTVFVGEDMRTWNECSKWQMVPPLNVIVVGCVDHELEPPF